MIVDVAVDGWHRPLEELLGQKNLRLVAFREQCSGDNRRVLTCFQLRGYSISLIINRALYFANKFAMTEMFILALISSLFQSVLAASIPLQQANTPLSAVSLSLIR